MLLREGAYHDPKLAEQLLCRLCEKKSNWRLCLSHAFMAKSKWGNEEAEQLLAKT
jgi:hypothetical protein